MPRHSYIAIVVAAGSLAVATARAQDDAAPPAKPPVVISDPLARDLVATNPDKPAAIVRVLLTLIDLRQAKAGQALLAKLAAQQVDDAQAAAIAREFGTAGLMKLAGAKDLNPEAAKLVDTLLVGATRYFESPEQVKAAIEDLKSPDDSVRAAAVGRLQLAHEEAVLSLVDVLVDDDRQAEFEHVEQALAALGADSLGPLGAVVEGAPDKLKIRALAALGRMHTDAAAPLVLGSAFSASASPDVRRAALAALAGFADRPADAGAAAGRLYALAVRFARNPPRLDLDEQGLTTIWSWKAADEEPVPEDVAPSVAAWEQAVRLAAGARSILPAEPDIRRLHDTALLELQIVRAGGLAKPLGSGPGTAVAKVTGLGPEAVADLLEFAASEPTFFDAATVASRILGQIGSPDLLLTDDGRPSLLVRLLDRPDRRLRFALLDSIMRLEPGGAYPGSSFVADALRYFINTTNGHAVLVGDTRMTHAAGPAGLAAAAGFEPRVATNRRDFLALATTWSDYDFVLLDMSLGGPLGGQVIQDLRRSGNTADLPIALLASTDQLGRALALAREFPHVVAALSPLDRPAMDRIVGLVAAAGATRNLPPAERLAQANQALDWLKTSVDRGSLPVSLRTFETVLVEAHDVAALRDKVIDLLARLDTPAAQRTLADLASQPLAPLPTREQAATALVSNIDAHGTLLTSREIVAQYDHYNASEQQPAEVQKLLGSILDAIERYSAKHGLGARLAVGPATLEPANP